MKIYLHAFETEMRDWFNGIAMAEDGEVVANHVSSSIDWAKHDLGFFNSDWQHQHYLKHCPEGYELVWVDDVATHEGWQAALVKNRALAPKEEEGAAQ